MTTDASPPADGSGLTWRHLAPDDVDDWFRLVHDAERHDRRSERTARTDLEGVFTRAWSDPRDTVGGLDADGVLRAAGRIAWRPSTGATRIMIGLPGHVDPAGRGRGVGRTLLAWQLARGAEIVDAQRDDNPGLTAHLAVFVEQQQTDVERLARAVGLEPLRHFVEMRRDLRGDLPPAPAVPEGLELHDLTSPDLAAATRVPHDEAFADHWVHTPYTAASWQASVLDDVAFRPALSRVLVDTTRPDRPIVAYAVNAEYEQDWDDLDHTVGYTEVLGTVRTHRGRGLARLLLDETARAFATRGHRWAELGVDTASPTGADRVYTGAGYAVHHRESSWGRTLEPPT